MAVTGPWGRFWRSGGWNRDEEFLTRSALASLGDFLGTDSDSNRLFIESHLTRPLSNVREQVAPRVNPRLNGEEITDVEIKTVLATLPIEEYSSWLQWVRSICEQTFGSLYLSTQIRQEAFPLLSPNQATVSDLQIKLSSAPGQLLLEKARKLISALTPAHVRTSFVYDTDFQLGINFLDGGTTLGHS